MNEEQLLDKLVRKEVSSPDRVKAIAILAKLISIRLDDLVIDSNTFEGTSFVLKLIYEQQAVDNNWKVKQEGSKLTLLPTAVFWLFCWADVREETKSATESSEKKKAIWELFKRFFAVSYQNFRDELEQVLPNFNTKDGHYYPIKDKLRANTEGIADRTLKEMVKKLYPETAGEQEPEQKTTITAGTSSEQNTDNTNPVVSVTTGNDADKKTANAGGTGLGNKTPRKPVNLDSIVSNQEEEVTRKLLDELDEKTLRLSGYQDNLARKVAELTEEDVKNIIKEAQGKAREEVVTEGGKSLKKLRRPYVMECYKKLYNYTCQFCGTKIKKKTDLPYIEACHIIPVAKGGNDDVNNVLVLCPNCHKKFDLGKTELNWNESRTTLLSVILIQEDEDGHEQKCERIVKFKSFTGENNT